MRVVNFISIIVCSIFALLVSLRGATRDTEIYLQVFRSLNDFPYNPILFQSEFNMEWGYGILAGITRQFGVSSIALFFIISALTFIAIANAAKNFGLNILNVLPFYLPTFFLTQQLMQIRQGIAIAFSFWAISTIISINFTWLKFIGLSVIAFLFHSVSLVPIFAAVIFKFILPCRFKSNNLIFLLVIFFSTIIICNIISYYEIYTISEKLTSYLISDDFGQPRSIFDLANIRSIILSIIFIIYRPNKNKKCFYSYSILLNIFIASLGIRIGFIDVAVLSGRIGSSLGFSEIFLLAFILKELRLSIPIKTSLISIYLIFSFWIALYFQIPFIIDDYFSEISQ